MSPDVVARFDLVSFSSNNQPYTHNNQIPITKYTTMSDTQIPLPGTTLPPVDLDNIQGDIL